VKPVVSYPLVTRQNRRLELLFLLVRQVAGDDCQHGCNSLARSCQSYFWLSPANDGGKEGPWGEVLRTPGIASKASFRPRGFGVPHPRGLPQPIPPSICGEPYFSRTNYKPRQCLRTEAQL